MTPRTKLGRVLLTGGDGEPVPKDAYRTREDIERTVAIRGLPLTPEERQDVLELSRALSQGQGRRG